MLGSILSFSPELADRASVYCEQHSNALPKNLEDHWEWTTRSFGDADKMSSLLQGQWMIFTARDRKPKRILEIGTYSGYSALAWYEGTRDTGAEIITLELNSELIKASKQAFKQNNAADRIKLIEGPASDSLDQLDGKFDLVFVDANKDGYEDYVKKILDRKLLSTNGIILCDNVFARGLTLGPEFNPYLAKPVRPYWTACGKSLHQFSEYLIADPRIDVVLLPLFDGIGQIKWKSFEATNGVVNGHHNGVDGESEK